MASPVVKYILKGLISSLLGALGELLMRKVDKDEEIRDITNQINAADINQNGG